MDNKIYNLMKKYNIKLMIYSEFSLYLSSKGMPIDFIDSLFIYIYESGMKLEKNIEKRRDFL